MEIMKHYIYGAISDANCWWIVENGRYNRAEKDPVSETFLPRATDNIGVKDSVIAYLSEEKVVYWASLNTMKNKEGFAIATEIEESNDYVADYIMKNLPWVGDSVEIDGDFAKSHMDNPWGDIENADIPRVGKELYPFLRQIASALLKEDQRVVVKANSKSEAEFIIYAALKCLPVKIANAISFAANASNQSTLDKVRFASCTYRRFYNIVDIRKPKIHIKFGDCKDNGIATVFLHLDKIFFCVFYVV